MEFNALIPELLVRNIFNSLEFYVNKLDFEIVFSRPEQNFYFLHKQGAQLMLNQIGENSWLNGEPLYPFGVGLNLAFKTASLSDLKFDLLRDSVFRNIEEHHNIAGDTTIVTKQIIFSDPDGYLIRFIENV